MTDENNTEIKDNIFSEHDYSYEISNKMLENSNNSINQIMSKLYPLLFIFSCIGLSHSLLTDNKNITISISNFTFLSIILIIAKLRLTITILKTVLNFLSIFLVFHVLELLILVFSSTNYLFFLVITEMLLRFLILKVYYPIYKLTLYTNIFTIYYYIANLEKFHNNLSRYFVNNIVMYSYFLVKITFLLFLISYSFYYEKYIKQKYKKSRELLKENDYYSDLLDNLSSGIIMFNIEMEIIFQNNKYSSLLEQLSESIEKYIYYGEDNPKALMEYLISNTKKENINNYLSPDIVDFFHNELYPKSIIREIEEKQEKIEKTIKIETIYAFLLKHRDEFYKFTKISTVYIEEKNKYNYYEIYLRIGHNQIEFLFNELTNLSRINKIKLETDVKGLLIAKIAHDFKTPICAIENFCNTLKQSELANSSSDNNSSDEKIINSINSNRSENVNINGSKTPLIQNLCRYILCLVDDLNVVVNGKNN